MPHGSSVVQEAAADPLPPWRPLLRAARQREGSRSPQGRWLQLATVAADGSPRVRTLVFRGWAGPAQLDLLTDARSAKAGELAIQPEVELCWLLPRAGTQFRLRGRVVVLDAALEQRERLRHWRALSPAARALWDWPPPGAPLDAEGGFAAARSDADPLPVSFLLLRIGISQVERLDLNGHPHRRHRWLARTGWLEEALNP